MAHPCGFSEDQHPQPTPAGSPGTNTHGPPVLFSKDQHPRPFPEGCPRTSAHGPSLRVLRGPAPTALPCGFSEDHHPRTAPVGFPRTNTHGPPLRVLQGPHLGLCGSYTLRVRHSTSRSCWVNNWMSGEQLAGRIIPTTLSQQFQNVIKGCRYLSNAARKLK